MLLNIHTVQIEEGGGVHDEAICTYQIFSVRILQFYPILLENLGKHADIQNQFWSCALIWFEAVCFRRDL